MVLPPFAAAYRACHGEKLIVVSMVLLHPGKLQIEYGLLNADILP